MLIGKGLEGIISVIARLEKFLGISQAVLRPVEHACCCITKLLMIYL